MISIDLDSVLLSTDNDNIVESEPYIDLSVNFKKTLADSSVQDNRYVISKKLNTINTMRIEPRNFLPTTITDYSPYSMHLESIMIRRDTAIYNVATGIKNIIHSIVVVCE
jgi:tRNA uridine 5-carbamoylmethylation protein Kti12